MARTKATLQKLTQNEKAERYVSDEGTRKNSRKTTKWSGDRQPSRKRIQNGDSEDDPGSWKKNEDAKNVYQRPRRTKEKMNRDDSTLEMKNQ